MNLEIERAVAIAVFFTLGLIYVFAADYVIRMKVWWFKLIGAELKSTERFKKIIQAIGAVFLILCGLILLLDFLS